MILRILILVTAILAGGCISTTSYRDSIDLDPSNFRFFPGMCILGLGPKYSGQLFVPDSNFYGKTVRIIESPDWESPRLAISFDTVSLNRLSGIVTVVGKMAVKESGEPWFGAIIVHVKIENPCTKYHGEPIDAKFIGGTTTNAAGRFRISFLASSGDILSFDDVGAHPTICCIDFDRK